MKKIKIFLIILFLFLFYNRYAFPENSDELYQKIDLFSEVLEKIKEDYVDDVDQAEVMDAAINGVLQSLDPYSAYMNQEMLDSMETETKGAFGGLGIEVGMEAGVVKVISPIDDTPASRAGVKAGDYIVRIDNTQVQGKTLMEAVNLMRGPPGAPIEITIRRKGEKKAIVVKIVREIIQIKSVTAKIIDKSIGYFRLSAFNENSGQQLKSKMDEFKTNNEIDKFILDLRNNPGGLLSQAIKISDFFLDDGEIVSTRGRNKRENRKWFAKKGDQINGKPLIVLINYGSASASEIVAGALKDHKRAILIGENSYGKGSVQSIIPLKNQGAIRLTISKYYLPSGKSISEVGVIPDFEVEEETAEDFAINTANDNQLNFAVKLFNG
ncbi:MAG: S41 family peptidase [Pelagibacteraceae bacterium]|jgi:carboxyl-terminal processing protease|nr:S41 family peptidase [Pelagibacteraceae bacterium]|tara:strand:- start:21937 stop:23082 length:1146 start_codon:yes stop_codon:yes gene_type:complete